MKYLVLFIMALVISACGSNPVRHSENYTKTISDSDTIYQNEKTDSPAILVISIAPNYPKAAYNNLIEGFVEMEIVINEAGSVINVEVINSEPRGVFDKEAIRSIKKYKFKPAYINKKAVLSKMKQKIQFKLSQPQ